MNWNALKDNQCPVCGEDLDRPSDGIIFCCDDECSFKIREERMQELLDDMEEEDSFGPYQDDVPFGGYDT